MNSPWVSSLNTLISEMLPSGATSWFAGGLALMLTSNKRELHVLLQRVWHPDERTRPSEPKSGWQPNQRQLRRISHHPAESWLRTQRRHLSPRPQLRVPVPGHPQSPYDRRRAVGGPEDRSRCVQLFEHLSSLGHWWYCSCKIIVGSLSRWWFLQAKGWVALPSLASQLESPAAFSSCCCWLVSSTSASTSRRNVREASACLTPNWNDDSQRRDLFMFRSVFPVSCRAAAQISSVKSRGEGCHHFITNVEGCICAALVLTASVLSHTGSNNPDGNKSS